MANGVKICVTLLALTACDLKSTAVDEAVMAATFKCASYAQQQHALVAFRAALGTGKNLPLRCDSADCSNAFATGPAFGGKVTIQASPGYLAAGWFNNGQPPSEPQKTSFKAAAESVTGCKLTNGNGW
jgi:hypothetical protein